MRARCPGYAALAACALAAGPALGAEPAPARVRAGGFAHLDWVVGRESSRDEIDPATGEPLNENRFVLTRARARIEAERGAFGGRLELDANTLRGPALRPFEANLWWRWPRGRPFSTPDTGLRGDVAAPEAGGEPPAMVMATLGLFRVPFGFDTSEPATARPWLERSTASRALFAGARDLGVGVDAAWRFLRAAIALQNGEPLDAPGFGGRDPTRSKDLVGRVGVDVEVAPGVRARGGVSWLAGRGLSAGSPATKDTLNWVDGNENGLVETSELSVLPGAPARPSRGFGRSALGADLRLRVEVPSLGALVLRAEIVRAENLDRGLEPADPVAAGRDLREIGWQIGASQEVGPNVQIALRYDAYDPDADARRQAGVSIVPTDPLYATWALAVAARFEPVRLVWQYDHQRNPLGRAASGAPTTLRDDAVTLRGEVRF
ncbi:MAG TPA: hypothetical protein VFS43_09565 [Polyangiaceae bacterium]|nr:hypothetical protein [Polyangiaceae bacterium]